jgi:ATP-dependent helicase HrpA
MKNEKLPVAAYEDEILAAVSGNAATIVTAETGAGKSTQVPQFLANAGYRVIVTQPRRLAARALAQRVAHETDTRLGNRVGYRTAEERADSAATEILFVTDGLQLVRELAGQGGSGRRTVLVLDEVHEWNLNIEVLIAWTKSRLAQGDDLKVVLMSATLDAVGIAAFYENAPVISVTGRLFPVERRTGSSYELLGEAERLAKAGRSVLVFQPGKKEIAETVSALQTRLGEAALVLPLHGELEPAEQQRCFAEPPKGMAKVVVATNVAQTSVTIPDIDAVVDSGVERRVELADGIEGLYLKPVSRAACDQRAGRAGRTKAGVYVLCSETGMADRVEFPTAEILRSRLDQLVLRLAVQGFDATALEFFHQPDATVLAEAKRALVALGAMSSDGSVTKTGRRMARFPVSVQFARMLIEAERYGVVELVATIAACLEAGDIRSRDGKWKLLTGETRSDLLALLDVYGAGKGMKNGSGKSKAEALRETGIFAKNFFRAGEIRRKLLDAVGRRVRSESKRFASKDEEREAVLRACVAGMVDHLYHNEYGSSYRNGGNCTRELARESVVHANDSEWIVGLPFDISGKGRRGYPFTLHLVGMATAVEPAWLVQVAPHLAERRSGLNPRFDPGKDSVVSTTETFFNGQSIREEEAADPNHPEAAKIFCSWLTEQMSDDY